jgi:photosystem II stability/assembly factor-like uncharacterized protein
MAVFKYPFKRSGLAAAVLLAASLIPLQLSAQGKSVVPDVLEMPAMETRQAQSSLQLGISRAGQRLVSVGVRGIVLLSDDEGKSWRQASHVPVSVTLTDVEFVTPEHGWAIGHSGVLLFSGDGGETWERRMDGSQAARIVLEGARQQLLSGTEGAEKAVRNAEYLVDDGPDKPFLDIVFADENRGYMVGAYGLALETLDGGSSWQSMMERIPNSNGNHLYQILPNGEQLLIVGEQGAVFLSQDGGQSFEQYETPYAGTFFGAQWLDDDAILVFGLQGNIWRSIDSGGSWQQVSTEQPVTITTGLSRSDGSVLLADESGHLLRSDNNGASFAALPVSSGAGATGLLESSNGVVIVSSMRGVNRLETNKLVVGGAQ